MISKAIRKAIEEKILKTFSLLDRSGRNTTEYQNMFKSMDDTAFEKFLKTLGSSFENNFYLEVLPWENEPTLNDIKAAAKEVGYNFKQFVYIRDEVDSNGKPVRTRYAVPVGYMHVKRLQQILTKKTGYSTEISQRNPITGQLSGASSVGRIADEETIALATVEGTDEVLKELLGPRADNKDKRLQMYQSIQRDGFVNQKDLVGDSGNQSTLNYLDVVLTGAGYKTDLVNPTELSRASLKKNSQ